MFKPGQLFQPPSVRSLVLFGFALVVLPLLIALLLAIYSIDTLTTVSRVTVYRAVSVTKESQILLEKLNIMERSAQQYFVLADAVFFRAYEAAHDEFVVLIHDLINMVGEDRLWRTMKELAAEEFELYRALSRPPSETPDLETIAERFKGLNRLVHDLREQGAVLVNQEVGAVDDSYQDLKKRIFTYSTFSLPMSIFFIAIFVYLIIKPIRQLDHSIKILGRGDFESPIEIHGTMDFEYLGSRLNWLRQRLKQLEENKQRFLRNVSHELKTPLATINEGVCLLADQVVGELNTEQTDIVKILQGSSTKLDQLIEDLLKFSQLQSQMADSSRETIDLRVLLESVINEYRINLRAKDVVLSLNLVPVTVFGVRNEFRVIADNLLSNAVKYSPDGGEIRITLCISGNHIQLEFEDQGPGIAPEERQKVFDLFYQGRATRHAGIKGSGLGLAIVKEYVSAHHGSIEILDPSIGKTGAHVRVMIPRDPRKRKRKR
ncbi:MAG: HAMP domain-containing histidine kinase [Methylococcaceae bacterium]|nr:HAMP domain-containing histidine kinase [Methylococcaceae bacterium]